MVIGETCLIFGSLSCVSQPQRIERSRIHCINSIRSILLFDPPDSDNWNDSNPKWPKIEIFESRQINGIAGDHFSTKLSFEYRTTVDPAKYRFIEPIANMTVSDNDPPEFGQSSHSAPQPDYRESHLRTFLKTMSWRVVATTTTIVIAFFVFGNIGSALKVGGIEFFAKILIYYVHERLWQIAPRGTIRKWAQSR